ncbi:MAG: camphor resistance protein CrcB [Herminiimonas sp.]|nr:camphor resistance protein CrcB [Herminiimonas sp.]
MSWLAVGIGAACGAWMRWWLGILMNAFHTYIPLGTLAANLGGGFLIGIAIAFFERYPGLAPEWRLLLVTGFLGGLTTFSTFSAETMGLLLRGDYAWAFGHTALHLLGSLAFCLAGFAAWRAFAG